MQLYRKTLAGLMALLMLCSLCSCGSKQSTDGETAAAETGSAAESQSAESASAEESAAAEGTEETPVGTVLETMNPTTEESASAGVAPESEWVNLPADVDDGQLTISNMFSADLPNPDCNNEDGTDLAAIEVVNNSTQMCASASIDMTAADGTPLHFQIYDLPAGQTVWAFDTSNTSLEVFSGTSVTVDAIYEDYTMFAGLDVSVSGTDVTLTNNSGQTLTDLTVYCHSTYDGVLFGGQTYCYQAGTLSAGESTTVNASDCWIGDAVVVRVTSGY